MPADGEVWLRAISGPKKSANDGSDFHSANFQTWPDGSETIAIRISELWKRYGKLEAVRGISFEVGEGEIFGLIGPDGAGKTSTFQILAGSWKQARDQPKFSVNQRAKHAPRQAI